MTLSDIIGAMRSVGCRESQIDAVVLVLAKLPPTLNAERQARYKARKRAESVTVTSPEIVTVTPELPGIAGGDVTVTLPSRPRAHVRAHLVGFEENIFKKLSVNTESKEVAAKPTPKSILEVALSPEMATAVIDHRRVLKFPLTNRAAELLVKALTAEGDANANADTMIERGWRGFKAKWLTDQSPSGRDRKDTFNNEHSINSGTVDRVMEQIYRPVRSANSGGSRETVVRLLPKD